MRVAIIAGSISGGFRIAREIESLPGVEVFVVACNVGMRSPLLRWSREFLSAFKSLKWGAFAAMTYRYARQGRFIILHHSLDDGTSIERLRSLQCDVGLHAANVIYREPVISAFRLGILNAHIGVLPEYRGRSVAEWSLLQGDPTGVTVFFIDSGIDTGDRIILREFVSSKSWRSVRAVKNMLFRCDAHLYRKALEALMSAEFSFASNDISKGHRYYVMSRLFTKAVNKSLATTLIAFG